MAKSSLVKYRVENRTSVQVMGERFRLTGSAAARPAAMARTVKTVESCIFLVSPFEIRVSSEQQKPRNSQRVDARCLSTHTLDIFWMAGEDGKSDKSNRGF